MAKKRRPVKFVRNPQAYRRVRRNENYAQWKARAYINPRTKRVISFRTYQQSTIGRRIQSGRILSIEAQGKVRRSRGPMTVSALKANTTKSRNKVLSELGYREGKITKSDSEFITSVSERDFHSLTSDEQERWRNLFSRYPPSAVRAWLRFYAAPHPYLSRMALNVHLSKTAHNVYGV